MSQQLNPKQDKPIKKYASIIIGRITAATKDPDERVRESAGRAMRQIQNSLNEKRETVPLEKGSVTN